MYKYYKHSAQSTWGRSFMGTVSCDFLAVRKDISLWNDALIPRVAFLRNKLPVVDDHR